MGGRTSPKLLTTSPSGSLVTLAMGSRRCSSPLAKHVVTQADEAEIQSQSTQTRPDLTHSRLRPSGAELDGTIKHDPAVDMSWDVPPSPKIATYSDSDSWGGNGDFRSPSILSHKSQTADRYLATSPPHVISPKTVLASTRYVTTPEVLAYATGPLSSQTMSSDVESGPGRRRELPPYIIITNPPQMPLRAATAGRMTLSEKPLPLIRDIEIPSMLDRARGILSQ